jgi:hypothetical protein
MVILTVLFIIQLVIGSVCITLSYHIKSDFLQIGWNSLKNETKSKIEKEFQCCGFKNVLERTGETINCQSIPPCFQVLEKSLKKALRLSGALSLTFSFFQVSFKSIYKYLHIVLLLKLFLS